MSVIGLNDIKKIIPHRYPFLLVDRVLHFKKHKEIHAIKNVSGNEPFFQGHFPSRPVMPGVLIIEALAQTAGILIVQSLELPAYHKEIYFLAGVDKARFKRVVEPGDQLSLSVEVLKIKRDVWKFLAMASVDKETACLAEIMTVKGNE